jgi:hypothetical protein
MGSENVFNVLGLGRQTGDAYAPGDPAAATFLYPVEEPMSFELDRGAAYPKQDRGRNVRNNAGSGYFGIRSAGTSLSSQARFGDLMDILEMCYAGNVNPVALGGGLYRWDYLFEAGAPTVVPYTLEGGNIDDPNAMMRLLSCLVGSLTLGFPTIPGEGAAPWTLSADILAFDREIAELTDGLVARPGLEVVQGHLTKLYQGDPSEAYSALAELPESLKSFTMTPGRELARRAYGGDTDLATRFGFSDTSNATFESTIAVSNDTTSDFHDIWNVSAPTAIGERRWRVLANGSGGQSLRVDALAGILGMPIDEADGERLFKVTGEFVDDEFLDGSHQVSVTTTVDALE